MLRTTLLASSALCAFALAAPAFAQGLETTPPAAPEAETAAPDKIVTTGTRIEGVDLDGATQAIQIDREAIAESGATSVIDLLRDLPITSGGAGTFSTSTAGPLSSDTPVGASGVSLRGLGTSSTLTLINSRRANISAFARGQESFIDVNAIPLAAIERVEVLPSGASAIYGADAVAGVVNYILRRDFEGAEVSASYGDSAASTDEGRLNLNGVYGVRLGDHHVMGVVDYFKRNALFDRDRAISRDSVRPSQQGFYPSFNDLFLMFNDQTEEPADGGCPADDFGVGNLGEFCEVDTNDFVSTEDELESVGGLFTHRFDIGAGGSWFNELLLQQSTSRGTGSPANFSRAPIDPENPNWPTDLIDDIVAEGGAFDFGDFFEFPIFAWGKLPDPRQVEVESLSYRFTSGLEGRFDNGWSYDTALLFGGNDRTQRGLSGLVRSSAFYDANLGNLCTDGTRVRRWDVNLTRPSANFFGDTCEAIGKTTMWYNPFGGQTDQVAGIAEALQTTAERNGESRLYAWDGSVSGDLFAIDGRAVKAAFGAEVRREELDDTPSGEAVATVLNPEPILGFSSTSARGERTQWSAYGELYIPLSEVFDVQLAGRYDEYDDFGGDFNPKIAARYAPIDSLILRGNWSTSFRAPSLAQSGAGVLLSSYRVSCAATPEACGGNPNASGQALLSEDVGNPNLGAESAETWGLGALFEPNDDIQLSLDYWNITHEDLVGIDEDDFIRRALAGEFAVVGEGLLPTGQPGLEVAANGFVRDAHFQITNLGYQKTEGFDFAYTQYIDTDLGDLSVLLDATYLLAFERQASNGSPVEELAGAFRYPELVATARLRWRRDDWRASIAARYTSAYDDEPDARTLAAVGLPADAAVEVDAWTVWDLNLGRDLTDQSAISLTIRNLFDDEPPLVLGTSANVDHINHDSMGRFVTLRVDHAF